MKKILIAIGIVLLSIILFLVIIIFTPVLSEPKEASSKNMRLTVTDRPVPENRESFTVKVGDDIVSAWLYLPQNHMYPVPCVILSNGFGGIKDGMLEFYAQRYAREGIASINYDYRYFGESGGEPRQYYNKASQLEDQRAMIAYARSRKEIDGDKIALFGTSGGGGYGMIEAATDKKIRAIISQCPALDKDADGEQSLEVHGTGHMLRLFLHGIRGRARSGLGLSTHYVPILGPEGSLAVLAAPGAFDDFAKLIAAYPPSRTFQNRIAARFILEEQGFNTIDYADQVNCPVHFTIGEFDNLVAPDSYEKIAAILGDKADVHVYPVGHFDLYIGDTFEQVVSNQITFLKKSFRD